MHIDYSVLENTSNLETRELKAKCSRKFQSYYEYCYFRSILGKIFGSIVTCMYQTRILNVQKIQVRECKAFGILKILAMIQQKSSLCSRATRVFTAYLDH